MGHTSETCIQIQIVKGGYILTTYVEGQSETEVFPSSGKLMKALRGVVEVSSKQDEPAKSDD